MKRVALTLSAMSLIALAICAYVTAQGMFYGVGSAETGEFLFGLAVMLALVARLVARQRVKAGWVRS